MRRARVCSTRCRLPGVSNPTPFTAIPIPFPDMAGPGHQGGYYFGESDYGLAVNVNSRVRNAALTFVTWMTTSKEGQQLVANGLNDFPSLRGITRLELGPAG